MMAVLNYVEVPAKAVKAEIDFYSSAFGWAFTEYGPEYAAHEEKPAQLGLNGTDEPTASILPLIEVEDIEAAHAAVIAAGGTVTREIRPFPGGRRFHFRDPAGHELGCYQAEA